MIAAIADTHAVVWYLSADPRLSAKAQRFIETIARNGDAVGISAITLVEVVYLVEKDRIPAQRFTQLADVLSKPESVFTELPLDLNIARALSQISVRQVPDMPDRIIAATAIHHKVPVISRDNKIRLAIMETIW